MVQHTPPPPKESTVHPSITAAIALDIVSRREAAAARYRRLPRRAGR
jgi:hypothetical protein